MGIYMMKLLVVVGLIAAAAAIQDSYLDVESFKGFQVFRVSPSNEDDRNYIKVLGNRPYYDFWSEVRKDHTVDIMAPPEYVHQLEKDLEVRGISYEVMIPDVDAVIQLEKITAKTREVPSADHPMTWDEYHPLEDMYAFLDYLENTYDFVTTSVIGSSGEGTPMRVVKVCKGGCGNKKAVWIDGGIHAREWISPATVTWMLRELVENNDYLYDLAMKGSDALTAVHGKYYETGCIPCLLYIASGSSADWALGVAEIDFSISMELRDTGLYGF